MSAEVVGRSTTCEFPARHPRRRGLQRGCLWVTVSGWAGEWCLCPDCRAFLRLLGRTVTNVDPDYRDEAA